MTRGHLHRQAMLKELNCPVLLIHGRQGHPGYPGALGAVDLDTDGMSWSELGIPGLANIQKTMEHHHKNSGFTHYIDTDFP